MSSRVTVTGLRLRLRLRPHHAAMRLCQSAPVSSLSTSTASVKPTSQLLKPLAQPQHRHRYATAPQDSRHRRSVTPFNDDGRVPWSELSFPEKTARAAQQTFNLGLVLVGVVLTVRSFEPPSRAIHLYQLLPRFVVVAVVVAVTPC
jgi:import inner membrane translocase subunit TIM21